MKRSRNQVSSVRDQYTARFDYLKHWATHLESDLRKRLHAVRNIELISARPKEIDSFVTKSAKLKDGKPKYEHPLEEIQDQLGARIVVLYVSDILKIEDEIKKFFPSIEEQLLHPDSEKAFGYVGKHFIAKIPTDVKKPFHKDPAFFELQIKTLFQHSWGQLEHDLLYKGPAPLTQDQRRKVAFTAAQAWGADLIFNELQKELNLGVKNA